MPDSESVQGKSLLPLLEGAMTSIATWSWSYSENEEAAVRTPSGT